MQRLRVAIIDDYQDVVRTLDCFATLRGHEVTIWNDHVDDLDALTERLADADALVLMRERTKVDAALLSRLPKLKLISQNGHVPHIDLEACTHHGVVVCSASGGKPSYCTVELTWGLILAAMRNIPFESEALRSGRWQSTIGLGLRGRTLGIYGFGKLGALVAEIGVAFGMNLLVWGRQGSLDRASAAGYYVATSRQELFEQSDVLSLHLRLNADTTGLIGPDDLARMKPTALIVNTSRAELIAPGALVAALKQGRPGKAAVDVFEREPLTDADDPLRLLPNALCTPHLGYVERDNYEFGYGNAFDQIAAFARRTPINVRNPAVLKQEACT
ncbi:D-2-hydroxyacid dehydrogenase family protein [Bradyrhizobium manausense]|uniref:D-2-hydroxyacid dehydrogenase family protein n=1 Tax=Bradyrhizobium TaxID=374 RepID=UPI001BA6598D|nr:MULTISPECIES: D-2-hydroxyacid dehydrogenase family protein [Bradyrhizobium]MBR0827735.1 D-2-hydroxyacid dehydrogenase family protein [Bradyrhizobium manausense]UVO26209.1 D-2-hydroxyacid dehydrogenase family protein [Bradyrhizobium arachidis]